MAWHLLGPGLSRSSLAETSRICIVLVPSALYAMSVWIGDDWYRIDTVLGDCQRFLKDCQICRVLELEGGLVDCWRFFGLIKDWNAVGALVVRW